MHKKVLVSVFALSLVCFIFACTPHDATAQKNLSLTFYGDPGCEACVYSENIVRIFVSTHSEVQATYFLEPYYSNATLMLALLAHLKQLSNQTASIPALVLNKSGSILVWYEGNITEANLEAWLGGTPYVQNLLWVSFFSGLIVGVAPCLLLMASVLGTTLVMVEQRSKFLAISTGLILGIIIAYLAVSAAFLALLSVVGLFLYFKYIFGGILITIGIWQIVEFKSQRSIAFGTPQKVKDLLKTFIEKRSGTYAFLLGMLFALVKIPCFGGVFLSLLYDTWLDSFFAYYIVVYFAGMLLPIVILLVALRIGVQPARFNAFREKYRPHLRLLNGVVLIVLTFVLIFFPL
ncbi:MAG TPA: cytochrome c biogenesis protein CcdA [Candidatus Lokiarchaeia archaeon]|nr:cytochrome c biogenesis protein CcdA [Candidatus Lokiarchaeia archaeon]